ncbi:MAG: hypothetical protein EPO09_16445 [Aquabacterium sp.]|uniref:hypothetical protein n=1 Tax=Aquabacterium sp. TaxID=1872578 RepID=UPI0011F67ABC|nr:hypothetical protein [Aquabacterium sp.]TAK91109.1 MAG: hypothetical protein EPO09_16445 [Aquabacterium sp.]
MTTHRLSPLAISAALACLMTASLAHAACPTTVNTVSLTSTSAAPLTHVAINNAIANASSTATTVINLAGTFNISGQINIPVGKNCVTLQSPSATSLATLKWTAPSSNTTDFMIYGQGNHDLKLNNLILDGRDVTLVAATDGTANSTVNNVKFLNSKTTNINLSGANYILRLLPYSNTVGAKNWTVTNSSFSVTAGQDAPYLNTAILAYLADTVAITGNTFTNVDEGVHIQGLRNANISSNTGTGLLRSAIELQEGLAMTPAISFYNSNITLDKNSFTSWRAGQVDGVLGISVASGNTVSVTNNTIIYQGKDLASCQATAIPAASYERWGMEFTAVNATAKGNTFCGFDYGIRIGYLGDSNFTSGIDKTTIDGNTIANMYISGVEMFPGDTRAFGEFGQKYYLDASNNRIYTETPAQAKARWASNFESITRQLVVNNNTFSNTRMTSFTGGDFWYNNSPVAGQSYTRVPENMSSHLASLSVSNNKISRAYGFFTTDITPTTNTPYNDRKFIALAIPAIRKATALGVTYNTISLTNSPSTPNGAFNYKGVQANPMLSSDDGKNYDTSKNFNGSIISFNNISASPNPYGAGLSTFDQYEDTWLGIKVTYNTLSTLAKGIETYSNWVRSGVTGNTCTNVLVPGPGC